MVKLLFYLIILSYFFFVNFLYICVVYVWFILFIVNFIINSGSFINIVKIKNINRKVLLLYIFVIYGNFYIVFNFIVEFVLVNIKLVDVFYCEWLFKLLIFFKVLKC